MRLDVDEKSDDVAADDPPDTVPAAGPSVLPDTHQPPPPSQRSSPSPRRRLAGVVVVPHRYRSDRSERAAARRSSSSERTAGRGSRGRLYTAGGGGDHGLDGRTGLARRKQGKARERAGVDMLALHARFRGRAGVLPIAARGFSRRLRIGLDRRPDRQREENKVQNGR